MIVSETRLILLSIWDSSPAGNVSKEINENKDHHEVADESSNEPE